MHVIPQAPRGGWPALNLRCRCNTVLDQVKAHATVTAWNVAGTSHRPDGNDLRKRRAVYEIECRRDSVRIDKHRWECLVCGARHRVATDRLEAAYVEALQTGGDLLFGANL